jgi:short-subunit dehydrogenase
MMHASKGVVIFNTALTAHVVIPVNAGYAASKSALESWVDGLHRGGQKHTASASP